MSQPESKPQRSLRDELFLLTIQSAVPIDIAKLAATGGPNDSQWDWVREFADDLGSLGDVLQFKEEKPGQAAVMMNRLTYALAILAFQPGGVTFAGLHFEATTSD